MKSKGILYNADMVRAWFAGRKTQTRVPLRTQPKEHPWNKLPGYKIGSVLIPGDHALYARFSHHIPHNPNEDGVQWTKCPYEIGMEIYGRETWLDAYQEIPGWKGYEPDQFWYKADAPARLAVESENPEERPRWRSSTQMPRAASRIHQTITGIRVERVCDISEEDAIAEGVTAFPLDLEGDCWTDGKHKTAYEYLWQSIYGDKYPWDSTFVWVLEFAEWGGEEILDKEMEEPWNP